MPQALEEAFIEAKKLKDAARQQAQADLIEKYANEVKNNMDTILESNIINLGMNEQDEEDELDLGASDEMGADLGGMGDFEFEDDLELTDSGDTSYLDNQVPQAYSEGENLCGCPEDDEEIEINFDDLISSVDDEGVMGVTDTFDHEEEADELIGGEEDEEFLEEFDIEDSLFEDYLGEEDEEEGIILPFGEEDEEEQTPESDTFYQYLTEEDEEELHEELVADTEEQPSGWSPRNDAEFDAEFDKLLARLNNPKKKEETLHVNKSHSSPGDTRTKNDVNDRLKENFKKVYKENKELNSAIGKFKTKNNELIKENKTLDKQASSYKEKLLETADLLQSLNLDNAKLRLQKKVFENNSLNERQKNALVEAISDAETPEEAKRIYKLQGTVVTKKPISQNPLTEALRNKPTASAVLQNSRRAKENETNDEMLSEHVRRDWQKLAGIKIK